MSVADTLQLLQHGSLEVEGLLPWSSNYTFLVQICQDDEDVEAVYKPQRGERPLWDFPQGTLYLRERAAFLTSQALDWHIVPATVIRDGPHGPGSVQQFVQHDPERHYFTIEGQAQYATQLQQIVLLDIIINNADRKGGHILLQEQENQPNRLWAIDHGVCFHAEYKLRSVIWEFAGTPIPPSQMDALKTFQEKLTADADQIRTQLNNILNQREIIALSQRLQHLIDQGIFPHPGPGRHYPWPPV
ncbi:MAG: SCO1664 family protein [Anaerolineae bacterium]|nr:SCO1664 family protein [Anaerolineae bacterium]